MAFIQRTAIDAQDSKTKHTAATVMSTSMPVRILDVALDVTLNACGVCKTQSV